MKFPLENSSRSIQKTRVNVLPPPNTERTTITVNFLRRGAFEGEALE